MTRKAAFHLMGLGLICLAGCAEPDSIRTYTVAKPTELAPADPEPKSMVDKVPTRMLAAMVDHADSSWFFKVMGDPDAVGALADDFTSLVEQISFTDDEPELKAPESWTRRNGSSMRFATFEITAKPQDLELSVIRLPKQPQLANVNRWRGQVGLAPLSDLQDVSTVKTEAGPALVVNLLGTAAPGGPRMPPFAPFAGGAGSRGKRPAGRPPLARPNSNMPVPGTPQVGPPAPGSDSADDPFMFSAPPNWNRAANDRFSKLAFTQGSARITATPMGAAALKMNLARWRGQLGLPPVDATQLMEETSDLETKSGPATYVRYFAEGTEDDRQAILGAVLPVENDGQLIAWFLKFKGTAKSAEANEEAFRTFVKSIEF